MAPFENSYESHILLGQKHIGDAICLAHWGYAPKQAEIQAIIDKAEKNFDGFVLVTPCGPLLPGNYEPPVVDYTGFMG